jgi:hypothetical protein
VFRRLSPSPSSNLYIIMMETQTISEISDSCHLYNPLFYRSLYPFTRIYLISNGYPGLFTPWVNRQEREAGHLPPSSAEVKNDGVVPHFLIRLRGVVLNYLSTRTTLPCLLTYTIYLYPTFLPFLFILGRI